MVITCLATVLMSSAWGGHVASAARAGLGGATLFRDVAPNVLPANTYYYDIEAYGSYCSGGGISCVAATPGQTIQTYSGGTCHEELSGNPVSCNGLTNAYADAEGLTNNQPFGTPGFVFASCEHFTPSGANLAVVEVMTQADTGSTYPTMFPGIISGNASLLSWFAVNPNFPADDGEGNSAQTSSINVSALSYAGYLPPYDVINQPTEYPTRVSITGVQNTDNGPDTLNSGGFRVTITGSIYRISPDATSITQTYGTISCYAGGPHAYDLANAFNTYTLYEGELEDGTESD